MSDIIAVKAVLQAREGHADELQTALRAVLGPSRSEDGNLMYELHRDRKDPNRFMFYEVWKSMDAIKEHNTLPHYKELVEKVGPLLAGPPDLTMWERVDSAN